jgi:hypothetical protein
MSNDTILAIETRIPFTFKLSIDNYDTIREEYHNYTNTNKSIVNMFKDIFKYGSVYIPIDNLVNSWNIVRTILDNHIRSYNRDILVIGNRKIEAIYHKDLDYITEMSIEIIINISIDIATELYIEVYKEMEELIVYRNKYMLAPMECLIIKPGSYVKTNSKNNNLLVFHISPLYVSDGFLGEPVYDPVFLQ